MVFRVVTLGVVVRKQKISSSNTFQENGHSLSLKKLLNVHNFTQHWQSGLFLVFPKNFSLLSNFAFLSKN